MTEESQQYVVLEDGEEARETLAEATARGRAKFIHRTPALATCSED